MSLLCQFCEAPLEEGYLALTPSVVGRFVARDSWLALTFSSSRGFEFDIIEPIRRARALVCRECGSLVITDEPWVA